MFSTEHEVKRAIAACQGQANPNSNDAILYAALRYIEKIDYGGGEPETQIAAPRYSFASEPPDEVIYDSGTEFSRTISGKQAEDVYQIMDELLEAVSIINPRLYAATINKLKEL